MGWSRLEVMKAMSKDEMILSGYIHSKHYCSYLKKYGKNSLGFLWQVNQMVKNLMYLLVLIEMVKGNKLHSKARSFMYKGKGFMRENVKRAMDFGQSKHSLNMQQPHNTPMEILF
eukprot:13570896-Ditylum_brightwellii.AAC.1